MNKTKYVDSAWNTHTHFCFEIIFINSILSIRCHSASFVLLLFFFLLNFSHQNFVWFFFLSTSSSIEMTLAIWHDKTMIDNIWFDCFMHRKWPWLYAFCRASVSNSQLHLKYFSRFFFGHLICSVFSTFFYFISHGICHRKKLTAIEINCCGDV